MKHNFHRLERSLVVVFGGAVLSTSAGCNEQYADAIVPRDHGPGGGVSVFEPGPGEAGAPGIGSSSSAGGPVPPSGDATLCSACDSDSDCGGKDDLCLFIHGEGRCGKKCASEHDCPPDYDCVSVSFDEEHQCVPETGVCLDPGPRPEDLRDYLFDMVNDVRERRGLDSLRPSECLNEIGAQALFELETEGTFKTKYYRECAQLIPNCDCNWQEESQALVSVTYRTWQEAAQYIFDRGAADPDGLFFGNVVSPEWKKMGVGASLNDDYLVFSLEFAP